MVSVSRMLKKGLFLNRVLQFHTENLLFQQRNHGLLGCIVMTEKMKLG